VTRETEVFPNAPDSIAKAVALLIQNEVVALPTETVYGLAGNAFEDEAIQKIFGAKERPFFDPLIVHLSKRYLKDLRGLFQALVEDGILGPEVLLAPELSLIEKVVKKYWPGPLTIILPRGSKIPDSVTASQQTVGIRCPDHSVFQSVLAAVPFPLAAPSANRFGRISPTEANHVLSELKGRIPAIIDGGACTVGVESTIIKIDFPLSISLLRPGKIGIIDLEANFKVKLYRGTTLGLAHVTGVTPGSLDEHYAPKKPLYLMPYSFHDAEAASRFLGNPALLAKRVAYVSMSGVSPQLKLEPQHLRTLSPLANLEEMAQGLFKSLRELDEDKNYDIIVADLPTAHEQGLGAAIADRLRRASQNKPLF
jgi:L-threonylcarbamoyladenylate synthase